MYPLFMLLALFAVKHFLASYPLQCSYTSKGLSQTGWFWPLIARVSIHGLLTGAIVVGYWLKMGNGIILGLLACAVSIDMVSHFLVDRMKVSKEFLGQFQVASNEDLAQFAQDYRSSNAAVVKAAQDASDSNKYFWWADGLVHLIYALVGLGIVYLVK